VHDRDRLAIRRCFRVLAALATLAPAAVLLATSFERRWMDDDGFINLRVVRNVLHGYGPVFNVGERVEAVTSPLWIGVLTLAGALRFRLERTAVIAGIAFSTLGLLFAQNGATHLAGPGSLEDRLRRAPLPLGAAIVAVLPPVWDYASSGLETGLALAWLGATFLAVSSSIRAPDRDRRAYACGRAALAGLGPLVRPDLAVYTAAALAILVASDVARARDGRARVASAGLGLACAGAAPLAYEVFRMGYYGALVPNTALAKEAFATRYDQGLCYLRNFSGTYAIAWPLVACAMFLALRVAATASEPDRTRRALVRGATLAFPLAAAAHALYIVRIGGDYMHGRMFVPVVFAALLPLASIPVPALRAPIARAAVVLSGVAVGVWLPTCALGLRVAVENECGIGDERGWYAREAKVDRPVELESYRKHSFYRGAHDALARIDRTCGKDGSCRRLYLEDDDQKRLAPAQATIPLGSKVDSRITAVVSGGAIGIAGYVLPARVHVLDRHGLADPFVARVDLEERGRPGHEKTLPIAWAVARFTDPAPIEDGSVAAARRALGCGRLADLERAVRGPLTWDRFLENASGAWARDRLRLPADPFDAETTFCGTPAVTRAGAGGSGGKWFQWRCPAAAPMSGVAGQFDDHEHAMANVRALCGVEDAEQASTRVTGPAFGDGSGGPFESTCPGNAVAIGIRGRADHLVRALGVVCSSADATALSDEGGGEWGAPFTLTCPRGSSLLGIQGRSGSLVDAVGLVCAPGP
jgi:arabinofuranosyltransferase